MKKIYFIVLFFFICFTSFTQTSADNIKETLNTDSIYNIITQNISIKKKRDFIEKYKIGQLLYDLLKNIKSDNFFMTLKIRLKY